MEVAARAGGARAFWVLGYGTASRRAVQGNTVRNFARPMTARRQAIRVPGSKIVSDYNRRLRKSCEETRLDKALDVLEWEVRLTGSVCTRLLCHLLQRCREDGDAEAGRRLQAVAVGSGYDTQEHVANQLIQMHAACGGLKQANQVFSKLFAPSKVVWAAIISAHSKLGESEHAIRLYNEMLLSGIKADDYVFVAALTACSNVEALAQGKLIHAQILGSGQEINCFVGSTLIHMYAKCGNLDMAKQVFERLTSKDLVTWNAMIAGLAQEGECQEAFSLFRQLQEEGLEPSQGTFVSLLKACSVVGALDQGRLLHTRVMEIGVESDCFVGCSLVDMYAKCGATSAARNVFDRLSVKSSVTWSAMLTGYVQDPGGDQEEALLLFHHMQVEGMPAEKVSVLCILKACANLGALEQGKLVHAHIVENEHQTDTSLGNTLVYMYANCESLVDARRVFDSLRTKDLISWNAMISAYAQQGSGQDAFRLFQEMRDKGVQPNQVTLVSILKACSSVAALNQGKVVHSYVQQNGFGTDLMVANVLVDMYARCGSFGDARKVFDSLAVRDVVSWNAVIGGCAQHGDGHLAVQLFKDMLQAGVCPDNVTFVCLLSACSHAGLLQEGIHVFGSMAVEFGICPQIRHYVCLVDLLGRSGCLIEAEAFVNRIPVQHDAVLWLTLLGACRNQGNVEIGRRAFDAILRIDETDAAAYVLMAEIYTAAGRPDDEADIRRQMQSAGVKKDPGRTWMELGKEVHAFVVKDEEHPERQQIYARLERLVSEISNHGSAEEDSSCLQEKSDDDTAGGQCDRLALAFSILTRCHRNRRTKKR